MAVESFSGFIQRHNMMIGILVSASITSIGVLLWALLSSILSLTIPSGFLFLGDIFLVVGNIFGLYLTFKYRKELQSPIKTGLIVGLTGSVLSLLLISLFYWILYSVIRGFNFFFLLEYLLFFLASFGIMYVLVGIIVGYLFGNYYRKKEDIDRESPIF